MRGRGSSGGPESSGMDGRRRIGIDMFSGAARVDGLAGALRDLVAEAVKEGVREGMLEALRESGLVGQRHGEARLLTVKEAAEVLRISPRTVYELIWGGSLRCVRIGRRVLVPSSAIDELAASGPGGEELPQAGRSGNYRGGGR